MHKSITLITAGWLFCLQLSAQSQDTAYWPKQIEVNDLVITIYAPEPEKYDGDILEARTAFSIFNKQNLPVFGAMWFRAQVHTNTSSNEVYFTNIQLVNADFSNATSGNVETLQVLIARAVPSWHFNSDLRQFNKNIEIVKIRKSYGEEFLNHPPKIYFAKAPTVLIYIDGEPILHNFPNTELYQYVVNTPHTIVRSSSDGHYYLNGGNWWYTTDDLTGNWTAIDAPPAAIRRLVEESRELNADDRNEGNNSKSPPQLIAVNTPAELIQTRGEPEISQAYENLFTVTNSDDEILFDSYADEYYVLIAGRWYKSKNLERGPWVFVKPEALPGVFAEIPPSSPVAHIRLSVPGTPEAQSAALNNGIPQTALIDRQKAKMDVQYDGEPLFEEIEGTSLRFAVNTVGSVLQSQDMYYAVDQAVWFMSSTPEGPWVVGDHFPEEVRNIPPSYPVYNLKFVNIYDATEEVVCVGYTPGYLGAYLFEGVVIYGTGYRYKSWYGDAYIPRPSTYGHGVKKKNDKSPNISFYAASGMGGPMMGVGFGGYPYGWGWGMGYGGYYGAMGYSTMSQAAYNQYYYAGQTNKVYADVVEEKPLDLQNIYNNRREGVIITETVKRNDPMKPLILHEPDHQLVADEQGQVFKLDQQGTWYKLNQGEWIVTDARP